MPTQIEIVPGIPIQVIVTGSTGEINYSSIGTSFTPPTIRTVSQIILAQLTFTDILRVNNGTAKLTKALFTDTQGICPDLDLVILGTAAGGTVGQPVVFADDATYQRQGKIYVRVDDWEFSSQSAIATPEFEPFPVVGLAGNRNLFGLLITKQSVQWQASNTFRVFLTVENN